MASSINLPAYSDALVVLATAGVVVPLVRRWGLNPVLGYLGAGVLLGPHGLGSFIDRVPALYWVTVVDASRVAGIADLGVVFLLFLIGVELSYERLMSMRRLVFGLGGLQVVVTSGLLAGAFVLAGQKAAPAVLIGACLALSSTAIVLEVLSRQRRLSTAVGRTSFSVLLAQDLAVIPILIYASILGADAGSSVVWTLTKALLHAVIAIALIVVAGRAVLRPLFRLVAQAHSSDLFIASCLFVIVGTGVVAAVADLSMALGAFVAGLLLAETEYRKAIEATIEPFKGLLLGLFFFTVGMGIDVRELLHAPALLIACVLGLIAVKAGVLVLLARAFRLSWAAALETGLLLAPGGEFAFVGLGLAAALGVITPQLAAFVLAVTSITMAFIPVLGAIGRWLGRRLVPLPGADPVLSDPALADQPEAKRRHAIVVGHGRVGKVACALLGQHGIAYTAADNDPATVTAERAKGHPVYYGDATSPTFLQACGVMEAAAVIVTIHTHDRIDTIVREVRRLRPDIAIVSRARDSDHARHLYEIGVSEAVPDTVEASLQLSEAALLQLGIPTGLVIASVHEQRDQFRRQLREAAKRARGVGPASGGA